MIALSTMHLITAKLSKEIILEVNITLYFDTFYIPSVFSGGGRNAMRNETHGLYGKLTIIPLILDDGCWKGIVKAFERIPLTTSLLVNETL